MIGGRDRSRAEHSRFRELAAQAVDGWIHFDDAAELEAHLAGCPSCRADQAAMFADHQWLATPSRVAPPAGRVREAILEAARAPRVPRTSDMPRSFAPLAIGAAAVVLIGVVALGLAFRPAGSGAPASPTAPGPSASSGATARPSASLPPVGGGCRSIPDGLSARWTFDDPAERLSGAPLQLVGDARFAEGISGTALELTGSTSEARSTDTSVGQLGAGDFTVAVWVRFLHLGGEQVIAERFRDGSPSLRPSLGWTLTKLENGQLRLAVATDRDSFSVDSAGANLTPEVWHHVAARRVGSTFSLVIDGREAGSATLPAGDRSDLSADLPLLLGRRGDDRGYHLDGDLDELLIWSERGLSDAELVDVRRAGSQGFCEAAAGAGYEGTWRATDCATSGVTVECGRWGDSSVLDLTIGAGETPQARFEDVSVAGCGSTGGAGPRVATGTGRFEGVHLWLTFSEVSCPADSDSWKNPYQVYKPFGGTEAMWFDPDGDGWGTVWRRV